MSDVTPATPPLEAKYVQRWTEATQSWLRWIEAIQRWQRWTEAIQSWQRWTEAIQSWLRRTEAIQTWLRGPAHEIGIVSHPMLSNRQSGEQY